MKNIKFTLILILAIISFAPVAETKAQGVAVSVNFSTFQQELSPHGRWMNNPRFGQVWINNNRDFRPYYTDGHWEYTNYGWSWASDYDWGWAPFHYGRWEFDPMFGWMWIPGYEWASAWVSWSSYDDYYGWAPLGYGININASFGAIPYNNWTFIPRRNICDRDINRYYVPSGRNNNFRNAVVINNYYNGSGHVGRFVRGPQRREVERYTSNRIQERRIDYNDRRSYSGRSNDDNNRFGRRNNDDANGNNRRGGRDMNRGDDDNNSRINEGRRQQNDVNRPQRFPSNEANQNGNQQNEDNRRRRSVNTDGNTSTPQTNENYRGRRLNENKPNQRNFPQRQQQPERQAPQQEQQRQPRFERPAQQPQQQQEQPQRQPRLERQSPQQQPQQREQQRQPRFERQLPQQQQEQRQPRFERQAPQQQQQPAVQQRSMERRSDGNSGGIGRRRMQQ